VFFPFTLIKMNSITHFILKEGGISAWKSGKTSELWHNQFKKFNLKTRFSSNSFFLLKMNFLTVFICLLSGGERKNYHQVIQYFTWPFGTANLGCENWLAGKANNLTIGLTNNNIFVWTSYGPFTTPFYNESKFYLTAMSKAATVKVSRGKNEVSC